jgi:hypothetical protein
MLVSAKGGLRSSRKRRSNTLNTDYHPELFACCGLAEPFGPLFFPPARRKLFELSRWDLKADLDRSVPANSAVQGLCNRVPGRASGCTSSGRRFSQRKMKRFRLDPADWKSGHLREASRECQNGTSDVEIQKQYFSDEANTGECV